MKKPNKKQLRYSGFLLVEMMVVISIVAVLLSIGVPSYRRYTQKAALIDVLQATMPYKLEVELRYLEADDASVDCSALKLSAEKKTYRYLSSFSVNKEGAITLVGRSALEGMEIHLWPTWREGELVWHITVASDSQALISMALSTFKFAYLEA